MLFVFRRCVCLFVAVLWHCVTSGQTEVCTGTGVVRSRHPGVISDIPSHDVGALVFLCAGLLVCWCV